MKLPIFMLTLLAFMVLSCKKPTNFRRHIVGPYSFEIVKMTSTDTSTITFEGEITAKKTNPSEPWTKDDVLIRFMQNRTLDVTYDKGGTLELDSQQEFEFSSEQMDVSFNGHFTKSSGEITFEYVEGDIFGPFQNVLPDTYLVTGKKN